MKHGSMKLLSIIFVLIFIINANLKGQIIADTTDSLKLTTDHYKALSKEDLFRGIEIHRIILQKIEQTTGLNRFYDYFSRSVKSRILDRTCNRFNVATGCREELIYYPVNIHDYDGFLKRNQLFRY